MARKITNSDIARGLTGSDQYWTYNGLDCLITREVFDVLHPRLSPDQRHIYAFERAMQAPAMTMMLRGIRIDETARAKAVAESIKKLAGLVASVNAVIEPYWDYKIKRKTKGDCIDGANHKWPRSGTLEDARCSTCAASRMVAMGFNPSSYPQVSKLIYGILALPKQYNKKHKLSTDDGCLSRLAELPKIPENARRIVQTIQLSRAESKQLGFLKAKVASDGRIHSSFNVGAPETGRWSSSKSPYQEGTNLQNIAEGNRHIFVADIGMELFYADLAQAESNFVAHLAGDEGYIEAHRSGDPHTYVARMLWPELPWNGDLKKDKEIAGSLRPAWDDVEGHDFRFQAKRVQHGSNYGLTPFGIALIAHLPVKVCAEMQELYFVAFPGIRAWQWSRAKMVRELGYITTPLRRFRQFFGRVWERPGPNQLFNHAQRQGMAFEPQSGVAEILNIGLWRVWNEMDTYLCIGEPPTPSQPNRVWMLAQVHDAILGQTRAGDTGAIRRIQELMTVPVRIVGLDGKERTMTIQSDCKIGQNWGKRGPGNPGGMK